MAKKKIQLQDANGNVLHPLTLGECVTMSNGENLDTLMSKSQMFTPTITQDKSMFKVGTGIDVDYSANVKDGAYESLVFKGKSLVNLITSGEMRAIANGGWVFANSNIRVDMLKPLTDYTLITYVLQNTLSGGSGFAVGKDGGTANGLPFCSLKIPSGEVGIYKLKMRTQSEITGNTGLRQQIYNNVASGQIVFKQVLLEGDYTTRDIPYFTGLCDSKMPILRNVGKNLCDTSKYIHGGLSNNNMIFSKNKYRSYYMKCKPSTVYTVKVENSNNCFGVGSSHLFSEDTAFTLNKYWTTPSSDVTGQTLQHTVTTAEKDKYLYVYVANNGVFSPDIRVQVEEAPSPTSYEPYKTNILHTSEEIVLREVNGVQDTYNALTGEYVQRIGEIVLDGSENEWEDWSETSFVLRGNYFSDAVEHTATTAPRLKCNNMVAGEGETPRTVRYYRSPTVLWTMVGKNNGETLDQFKTWLSQNPTTIQYILAEPATTIIKPSTMTPFAYQNGHVILESGFEGQSLLPEIEYSVVTGRTGQVTQNTKVLRKQEQQIIGLEELLLTQVVQMEYERTLLQFDYELQMMMLG